MTTPLQMLYDYQRNAVNTTFYNPKGVVCMPTSTGKTFCQAAIIAQDILMNNGQFRTYVINAPRILLTYQLLKEVYSFLSLSGIDARYMFVHSGGKTNEKELEEIRLRANAEGHDIPFSQINSGTSVDGIKNMLLTAKKQTLPIIIFSTYNSAQNVQFAMNMAKIKQPISLVLNDEAHYLVQEQFHDILNTLKASRCYFFTATMVHTLSDKGRGMNNVDSYGNVLFEMTPAEAIRLGKMVRPRMHFVRTDGVYNSEDYVRSLNKIIKDTFEQHEEVLKTNNQNPKLLISAKGSLDIVRFMASTEYRELRQAGVDIYAIGTSDEIGNDINGEKVRRPEFLKRLKMDGTNRDKKMIVLHYDILAEGIDVSGFTGIMPLRTLSKSKFLQTYGRAARLDPEDRKRIDAGEITYEDLDKMVKPYAYVIIPNIVQSNEDDRENIIQLINELRSFDFNPIEHTIFTTRVNGIPKREDTDGLNSIGRRLSFNGLLIENLEAEIEAEEKANIRKLDYLKREFL